MPALELDAIEARILGVLIEKETTTPDQYPLSLNAIVSGCNQKSNRAPTLSLGESEVTQGIERLRRKSLVGASHSSGSRIERYRHTAAATWQLGPAELAVIAELMLRGAQMPGELRSRAARMSPIETLDVLGTTLEALRGKGFVCRLEPLPGTRAPQWDQIVAYRSGGGRSDAPTRTPLEEGAMPIASAPSPSADAHSADNRSTAAPQPSRPAATPTVGLEARVAALEAEVTRLRTLFDARAESQATPQ